MTALEGSAFGSVAAGWMLAVEHNPGGDVGNAHGYIDPPGIGEVVASDGRVGDLASLTPDGWIVVDLLLEIEWQRGRFLRLYLLRREEVACRAETFIGRRWTVSDGDLEEP